MAALVLVDAEIVAGPLRLTTVSNEVKLELATEVKDRTTFGGGGWRSHVPGLRTVASMDVGGLWDTEPPLAGALGPEAELWGQVGGAQVPVIVSPDGLDQSVAYIVPTRRGQLQMLGKVGDLAPFGSSMFGDAGVARGRLIHPATVARTAGGTGTTAILGTVATGRRLLVALNVVAVTGTSPALTLTVQRDDNAGFTTPTTVATLGPVAVPTASLVTVAGPITPDDRYRVIWTLTGTSPSARFAVAVGITTP